MWIKSQDEMKMVKCTDFSYRYSRKSNQYEVSVNGKIMGYYNTLEDARNVFRSIENNIIDGQFMFFMPCGEL